MAEVTNITGTLVKVVDENMQEVPWDGRTCGEIVMRGDNAIHEYLREALEGGWFHTGDPAVVDRDGHIRIVDRVAVAGG